MRDLHNHITVDEALETIVVNNDTEGTGSVIDLKGFEAAEMVVAIGQSGDTLAAGTKFDLFLQHGDQANLSDAAAVPVAQMLGALDTTAGLFATVDDPAEDGAVFKCGYIGTKRYIRVFVDTTGTHTNGTPIGAVCVKARARHLGGNAV